MRFLCSSLLNRLKRPVLILLADEQIMLDRSLPAEVSTPCGLSHSAINPGTVRDASCCKAAFDPEILSLIERGVH